MNLNVITCPHYYKGNCIKASNVLGMITRTFPTLCNISCPKWGGPFGGKHITEAQMGKWAKKMLECNYTGLVRKVKRRYQKPVDIWIPDVAEEVKKSFAHLTALPWVKTIGLTGSILSKNYKHKDVDVVLSVTDFRTYLDAKPDLVIPKEVNGLKVDLFVSEQETSFFMTLDLNSLILYKSGIYVINSIDPNIKQVIDTNYATYANFREDEFEEIEEENADQIEVEDEPEEEAVSILNKRYVGFKRKK